MGFEELYGRLSPRLRWIARRRANGSVLTKEDDLYQEMCIYLWNNYREGPPAGINDAYIVKGCEFHILNYIRVRKDKVKSLSLDSPIGEEGATFKDMLASPAEGLDRQTDKALTVKEVMDNGFTKREKEVFALLLEGYTIREAGEKLGISHVMVVKSKKNLIKKWQEKEKRGYQEFKKFTYLK